MTTQDFLTRRSVTVILPAWNEADVIAKTVARVLTALPAMTPDSQLESARADA